MLDNTKKNLVAGVARVRWMAGFIAERTRADTRLAKAAYEKNLLREKIEGLYRDIGRRVLELHQDGAPDILGDSSVKQAIAALKDLDAGMNQSASQADGLK